MTEPHIEDELLDRYASGTLPVDAHPAVEEHLLACRFCQSRLVASDEFVVLFRAAAIQPDARPRPGWRPAWSPRATIWAAAAVMASALLCDQGAASGATCRAGDGDDAVASRATGGSANHRGEACPSGLRYRARLWPGRI